MKRDVARFPFVVSGSTQIESDYLPLMPIELTISPRSISVIALVDSGAMANVLPYDLGVQLGADWNRQSRAITLGGRFSGVDARGLVVMAKVADFAPVRLVFAWAKSDSVPLILGQANFFMEFNVCFFRSNLEFEVRPKSS